MILPPNLTKSLLKSVAEGTKSPAHAPMANTLGIAGSSLSNSIGTHFYTGGHTDINLSLGVAFFNFTQGEWGCIGKSGNSELQNIGFGFGAVANAADLYKLFTWDILSPEEKIKNFKKICQT